MKTLEKNRAETIEKLKERKKEVDTALNNYNESDVSSGGHIAFNICLFAVVQLIFALWLGFDTMAVITDICFGIFLLSLSADYVQRGKSEGSREISELKKESARCSYLIRDLESGHGLDIPEEGAKNCLSKPLSSYNGVFSSFSGFTKFMVFTAGICAGLYGLISIYNSGLTVSFADTFDVSLQFADVFYWILAALCTGGACFICGVLYDIMPILGVAEICLAMLCTVPVVYILGFAVHALLWVICGAVLIGLFAVIIAVTND